MPSQFPVPQTGTCPRIGEKELLARDGIKATDPSNWTDEQHQEALVRLQKLNDPLAELATQVDAAMIEYLLNKCSLGGEGRLQVRKYVDLLSDPANSTKGRDVLFSEVGWTRQRVWRIANYDWPFLWIYVNYVVKRTLFTEHYSRVNGATVNAAVFGDHNDRKLYYQLVGDIKPAGAERGGGNVTINFVVDNMKRELPVAVEAEVVGPEPNGPGPGGEEL